MDLTFSGAGFMGCYYFGVVDCWNKYIPRDRVNRVAGASAGSLIAAYYLMDLPLSKCLKKIIELTENIRSRPLGVFDRSNQMVDTLPAVLDEIFPEDAHKRVSGRLHVVMTRLKDMKKVTVSEFDTRQELIEALNCSCFIPVWSGNHVSTYKGVKHIDGGFSDNLPVFDEHTIRICCFSGATDISPYDRSRKEMLSGTFLNMPLYFTFANMKRGRRALFPPTASYILDLLQSGFHDTKTFILDNDLIQCDACWHKGDRPIYAQISPSITPAISRANSSMNLNELDAPSPDNAKQGRFLSASNIEPESRSRANSFNKLLKLKLKKACPAAPEAEASASILQDTNNNNNNKNPTIVIESETVESPRSSPDSGKDSTSMSEADQEIGEAMGEKRKRRQSCDSAKFRGRSRGPASGQLAFQVRRNTLLAESTGDLLVVRDRFRLASEPLPSCPPSPNLNRQCSECARMRQESRMDNLEDEIRLEVEKFRVPEQVHAGGFTSKLTSPLRWFKQLGLKSSYKFGDQGPPREIPAL